MRGWLGREAPDEVERVTGESLGYATSHGMDFRETADLALGYHEASGNDEVLISFLKMSGNHTAEARAIADKILDSEKRMVILKSFE